MNINDKISVTVTINMTFLISLITNIVYFTADQYSFDVDILKYRWMNINVYIKRHMSYAKNNSHILSSVLTASI